MGREAVCHCEGSEGAGEVRALLESDEIILRGGLKRRIPRASIAAARAEGDVLALETDGGLIRLALGGREAALWARKLSTPPPTLAEKLGVRPDAPALVLGALTGVLSDALTGSITSDPCAARVWIAVASDAAELASAVEDHGRRAPATPLWIVHPKGRTGEFNGDEARDALRRAGYVDTKVCAVSTALSAARFVRRGRSQAAGR